MKSFAVCVLGLFAFVCAEEPAKPYLKFSKQKPQLVQQVGKKSIV